MYYSKVDAIICLLFEVLGRKVILKHDKRGSFSGKIGFVLSAAGASVGLGNIWRFPYLCAKYGGGIFLIIYILLALTFGYTMIIAETAIGRHTKKSPVGAFNVISDNNKAMGLGGWINAIIPILIVPYYSVIGGWVCKYLFEYIRSDAQVIAGDTFFTDFISNGTKAEFWFIIFAILVLGVIFMGVKNGIERVSKMMMPVLVVLAIIICFYSVTRPGALSGVKYLFVPDFSHFSIMTVVTAMGQMFYSLSIAMGILITFGSYVKKEVSIEDSTKQVEIFDTAIAILASLMIIPAVFSFYNGDESMLKAGPSLMFITMPKIFASMGFGKIIGILFFALVLFAAVTSAIALTESAVSTFSDEFKWSRRRGTIVMAVIMLILGSLSSLGNGPLANVKIAGMQLLDFFDFLTNSVMMPIAAFATCILITRFMTIEKLEDEVEQDNHPFKRKAIFSFMIKFLCPVFVIIILVSAVLNVLGIISM
ncbi:MAG: sodium-dependent transporter [Pseudobutyrivibrio sp.]|nr:sodium-dependent transporter [Pseudobutyrivibrio sp.]